MKIVGAGLSKTGTMSLRHALTILGYKTVHNDMERLADVIEGQTANVDFRRYDDLDAVVDLPTAWFFAELLDAYPEAKCILTVRDEDAWWRSVHAHFTEIFPLRSRDQDPIRWDLRTLVYGSADPREFVYRKKFRDHNNQVRMTVPSDRLLVIDIAAGDRWKPLCEFLGHEIPDQDFPHGNERRNLRFNAELLNLANQQ